MAAIPLSLLIAGGSFLGVDALLKLISQQTGFGVQRKQIEAMLKSQQLQTGMGKQEQERMNQLVKQLLGIRREETRERREGETLQMLEASRGRQTASIMAMMQAMAGMGRQTAGAFGGLSPSTSLISLLR